MQLAINKANLSLFGTHFASSLDGKTVADHLKNGLTYSLLSGILSAILSSYFDKLESFL